MLTSRCLHCSATQRWIDANANSITNNEKWLLVKRIRLNLISEHDLLNCVKISEIDYYDLSEALDLIQSRYDNIIDFYLLTNFGVTKQSLDYHEAAQKARNSIVRNRAFFIANYNVCQEDFGFRVNKGDNFDESVDIDLTSGKFDIIESKKKLSFLSPSIDKIIELFFLFLSNYRTCGNNHHFGLSVQTQLNRINLVRSEGRQIFLSARILS